MLLRGSQALPKLSSIFFNYWYYYPNAKNFLGGKIIFKVLFLLQRKQLKYFVLISASIVWQATGRRRITETAPTVERAKKPGKTRTIVASLFWRLFLARKGREVGAGILKRLAFKRKDEVEGIHFFSISRDLHREGEKEGGRFFEVIDAEGSSGTCRENKDGEGIPSSLRLIHIMGVTPFYGGKTR